MKSLALLIVSLFGFTVSYAQIGINATEIDASAALHIQSGGSPKGLLTPRMNTADRLAISTLPRVAADGLIVYDTQLQSFYHYKTGSPGVWVRMNSEATGRLNFKRIKSTDVLATVLAAEKTAGGANYKLDPTTYYEINGPVIFDAPIELNNAYLVGLDANEDKILRTGNLLVGATGGTIKNLTITVTGGTVFNLSGINTETLLFRDNIVKGCSDVGSITGFGLVFSSVVQYLSNSKGIVYTNIARLLLNNIAWFGDNTGIFEKYTGTFNLIQKLGGFCEVNGTAVGVDVSSNPTINGDAVMESVVFTGSNTSGYVSPYKSGTPLATPYVGYNFNERWHVRCAGIPTETDATATATLYKTPVTNTVSTTPPAGGVALNTVATVATNMLRFTSTTGTLKYTGKKPRAFQASASVSIQSAGSGYSTFAFYFVRITPTPNGGSPVVIVLPESQIYVSADSDYVQTFPMSATVVLAENESVQIYVKFIEDSPIGRKTIDLRTLTFSLK